MNFRLVLFLSVLAINPANAADCPMAGYVYAYRFNEFFRGHLAFDLDCTRMAVLETSQSHILELKPSKRGWRASFKEYRRDVRGYWEINKNGTQVFFKSSSVKGKSNLRKIQ
ncbi:hypothetical protein [Ruegeria sp.]|uniref:hypothetical protein n=1 Tax=Ruegeria sp. TaxID=1879320 RepID=UPI00232272A7|nr:hypothetical protein [Ruegeria sp.]MDA7963867.1 hypothetical protein [Ruegeria sp.]